MLPLIKHGLVEYIPDKQMSVCTDCLQKIEAENHQFTTPLITEAIEALKEKYTSEVNFVSTFDFSGPLVVASGPENLIEHSRLNIRVRKIPKNLRKKFRKGQEFFLRKEEVEELGIANIFVYNIIDDLARQNRFGSNLKTNYLTQRKVDFSVAKRIYERKNGSNLMFSDHFSHHIPVAINANLEALVQFRRNEDNSFQIYRDALFKAMNDSKAEDELKMSQAFSDIVAPEINKIKRLVETNKKHLRKGMADDIIIAGGFLGLSIYTGMTSTSIGAMMTALGGIHFPRNLYTKVADSIRDPKNVSESSFYFLWDLEKRLS